MSATQARAARVRNHGWRMRIHRQPWMTRSRAMALLRGLRRGTTAFADVSGPIASRHASFIIMDDLSGPCTVESMAPGLRHGDFVEMWPNAMLTANASLFGIAVHEANSDASAAEVQR